MNPFKSSGGKLGLSFPSQVVPPLGVQMLLDDALCSLHWQEKIHRKKARWAILTSIQSVNFEGY